MESFFFGNKTEVQNGQHGWAIVKFKGYKMYVNAMVVSEETPNYLDTVAVCEAISKYIQKVQREITAHEAYNALIEVFGGAKVICEEIEGMEHKVVITQNESQCKVSNAIDKLPTEIPIERLRGQIESLCDMCDIDLRMIRKRPTREGLYVYATNGKQGYVELGSDYYTMKRMIVTLGYPIPFLVKEEYVDGVATGKTTRIDLVK